MNRLIIFVALFISVASQAQEVQQVNNNLRLPESELSFSATVLPSNGPGFTLTIDNPQKKKLNIWVRHSVLGTISDTIVYNEKLTYRYSLEDIDDGKYIITVSTGKEKFVKELEMTTVTTVSRNVVIR